MLNSKDKITKAILKYAVFPWTTPQNPQVIKDKDNVTCLNNDIIEHYLSTHLSLCAFIFFYSYLL